MASAVTQLGQGHSPVQFSGNNRNDKELAVQRAHLATEEARARLSEAQERWGKVTPAQKAGIKGLVGLILLAVGTNKKQAPVVRTLALLAAAGLLGAAGLDVAKMQKHSRLLPKRLTFEEAPKLSSPQAISKLKEQLAEEARVLTEEVSDRKLSLEQRIEKRMRLLEIDAAQAELEEQQQRLELNG